MEVEFSERIKSVFDVCDSDGSGYITVDHLKELARDHFGADNEEETIGIIHLLDPEGKGKINFQEFCKGVQEVLEVQAQSKQSTPTNSGNYSDLINSFSLGDPSPVEKQDTSEASAYTFNEYDTNTDEDGGGLLIDFSTPETARRNLFPGGHSSGRSSVTSRTDEENYEDFGVGESDSSDANASSCDSCHRARQKGHSGRHYRHKGPNRRIASALYASQLVQGSRSPVDDIYDDIDGSFQEMNTRIKSLEQQLTKVSSEKGLESDLKHRFKDENSILIKSVVDRIHTLEEQLKDMEVKSEERVKDEQRKYQEMMHKHGAEGEKLDYLTMRLQTFETENERLKTESTRLKAENEKLKMDKLELNDRLSAVEEDYNRAAATNDEMNQKFDRERVITGELLDELQKELEELRKYKIDSEKRTSFRSRNPSLSESNGYTTLQAEMAKLRDTLWLEWKDASKANKHLQDENEELNAQLLARAVQEGHHMMQEGNSLADELDHLTKEELMSALKDQQDVSFRLKQYIDKIILTILEKNPSILEV